MGFSSQGAGLAHSLGEPRSLSVAGVFRVQEQATTLGATALTTLRAIRNVMVNKRSKHLNLG